MLDMQHVNAIVTRATKAAVQAVGLKHVESAPDVDHEGYEALRVTLVLDSQTAHTLSGEGASNILYGIQRALQDEGELRFAYVTFVDEDEPELDDQP